MMELITEGKENFQKGYSDPWDVCNRRHVVPTLCTCTPYLQSVHGYLGNKRQKLIAKDLQVGQLAERMTSVGSMRCAHM